MNKFQIIIILAAAISCQRPAPQPAPTHRKPLISLATTPVKDQGKEEACWIYAYLACIETERIEQYGDSLNLSPLWLERAFLKEQARQSYLTKAQWHISMRSIGPEADRLLRQYGMVPYSNYHPEHTNTRALARDIYNKVEISVRSKARLQRLDDIIETALPRLPHNLSQGFYLYSMHYTPHQFGRSILQGIRFRWLTSFTHHPYGTVFPLELPDNRSRHRFRNVPVTTLLSTVITALRQHHPVYWEGDMRPVHDDPTDISVNENGTLSGNIRRITDLRQKAFEQYATTDQHAMAITGMTYITDHATGNPTLHFICKNSWGKDWHHKGYTLMSVHHFLLRTMFIGAVDCQHEIAIIK